MAINDVDIYRREKIPTRICPPFRYRSVVWLMDYHSFCTHCIRKWRKRKDECPVCRQKILSQTRCLALDNCIESMVKNLSPNTKARRQTLVTERKVAKPEQTSVIHDVFNESTDPNSSTDDDDDSSPSPRITPTSDNIEDLIEDYYNSEIWELNYRIY